jgi:hypothetical protein
MVKRSPKPIVYPIYKYLLHGEACICPKSACTHQSPPSADMCGRPAGAYLYRGYDRWYCIDLVIPPELSDEKDAAGGTGSRGCGLTPPGAKFGHQGGIRDRHGRGLREGAVFTQNTPCNKK